MIRYKIQLFSHLYFTHQGYHYFLYFSRSNFEEIFHALQDLETRTYIRFTMDPFDKEEDLDLFKARAVHKRLTELGVDCAIVKVDYEGQTFEQIN